MAKLEELTTAQRMQVCLAAAVGGIAPNVLHVAMCLVGEPRRDPGVNLGFVVGLVLLASLGLAVAWFWNERVPRRAFYLGIGLPAMLQIAMGSPTQQTTNRAALPQFRVVEVVASFLAPRAYAQPAPTPASKPAAQTLTIEFKNVPTDAQLVFYDMAGRKVDEVRPDWERNAKAGRLVVPVPTSAAGVEVYSAFARNAPAETLTPVSTQRTLRPLVLEGKSDFLAGFLRALGRDAADSMQLKTK